MALVDAGTLVIGTPTVIVGPHPNVAHAAFVANAIRPKLQFVSIIGSYGWGSKAVEQLSAMIPNLKVEVLAPVYCKGLPKEAGPEGAGCPGRGHRPEAQGAGVCVEVVPRSGGFETRFYAGYPAMLKGMAPSCQGLGTSRRDR